MPCIRRAPISRSMVGARLHSSDPRAKIVRPTWNTRRRPNRSPAAPESISSDASTRVYTSTTHCSCGVVADMSLRMDGNATLTMVASIDTISRLRQHETRMMTLRRGFGSVRSTTIVKLQPLPRQTMSG